MFYLGLILGAVSGFGFCSLYFFLYMRPQWKRQGENEFVLKLRENDMAFKKKAKTTNFKEMSDEEWIDYFDNLANNAGG